MNIINIILSVIVSALSIIFPIKKFSKTSISVKQFIVYCLIILPCLYFISIYSIGIFKIFYILIVTTVALYFTLFNKNLTKALYFSIVNEILLCIIELLVSVVLVSIFNFSIENYNNFSLSMFLFSLSTGVILYLISLNKKFSAMLLKFSNIISSKKYEIVYSIIILGLIILLLFFNKNNLGKEFAFYINTGMTLLAFFTLIYMIYNSFQNKKLENNYNEMMEYVQKYEKIINEQGKKNHEYNNQLMVIRGYVNNKKKLEEYLDLIINEHKCGQNYTIRELSYFPDGGIKGLIYHKLSKMEENNIKYYLYVDKNIKNIFEEQLDINTYQDITKLLGIFLDNAIDATINEEIKEIELDIKKQDECVIITISNTYNKSLDIKQVGKKGFTTKGIGHGYGLSIVKDITKHNNSIEVLNDIEDDKFKQIIIIYNKK